MFNIRFSVEKSIFIDRSLKHVFAILADFNAWQVWSPWLCQEKNCALTIEHSASTIGHAQEWQGTHIGAGRIELLGTEPNALFYQFNFSKPCKTRAQAAFYLKEQKKGTQLRWTMQGSLPFYLFFLQKILTSQVESDYERGLKMLKELLEKGMVESNTELSQVVEKRGFSYLGIKHRAKIIEMPKIMAKDFESFMDLVFAGKIQTPDEYLSLYHQVDPTTGECEFTSGLAYYNKFISYGNFVTGTIPSHHAVQAIHTGSYAHLANAWSTVTGYQRAHRLKANKQLPQYELYMNNPQKVASAELKTEINLPIK